MSIYRENNVIRFKNIVTIKERFFCLNYIHKIIDEYSYKDVILDFSECKAVYPTVMIPLCSYVNHYKSNGINFILALPNDNNGRRNFSNSNWAHLIDNDYNKSIFSGYTQVPASIYKNPYEQGKIVDKILDTIMIGINNIKRNELSAFEWALNEILDNVLIHSDSELGGIVQMTNYYQGKNIEIVVSDSGVGIPQSLGQVYKNKKETELLFEAIKEGITNGKGQGNGLFGSYQICELSKGKFLIDSGHATLSYEPNHGLHVSPRQIYKKGTTVVLRINTSNEVDLLTALKFKGKQHEPIDYTENKHSENTDDNYIINISQEADSYGSRIEGKKIQGKILYLLSLDNVRRINVNFENVDLISSSFADEAIVKAILEFGYENFFSIVYFSNISSINESLIKKSIEQRMNI